MSSAAIDVIVVTALPIEHQAVLRALGATSNHHWRGSSLAIGHAGAATVLLFPIGEMGNVSSAHAVTLAINIWNPSAVVLVGITGAFKGAETTMELGDVIVSDQVISYEGGKSNDAGLQRRYQVHRSSWALLMAARSVAPSDWLPQISELRPCGANKTEPDVFIAPTLSGEKVIASNQAANELRAAWPKALGVEMEGYGAALAAFREGPDFIMVKAICDFADSQKDDRWHAYAADASAQYALATIRNAVYGSDLERPQARKSNAPVRFSPEKKLTYIRNLGNSWEDLADLYDISSYERNKFRHGNEARDLWEWLELRGKLPSLPDMLDEIDRGDIATNLRRP